LAKVGRFETGSDNLNFIFSCSYPDCQGQSIQFVQPMNVEKKDQKLGAVSKLSFGPISALGVRFQSSKYFSIPPVKTSQPP
jgi:hypothetical protein